MLILTRRKIITQKIKANGEAKIILLIKLILSLKFLFYIYIKPNKDFIQILIIFKT